jgi:peptide chain release factor 2
MKVLISKLTKIAEEAHKDVLNEIKGDQSMATWGSQIRNYVFQPYTMVKDHRTSAETGNVQAVMDGDIDPFIRAFLAAKANHEI